MKSKLFLSLSILTAVFSVNAGSLMVISNPLPLLQKISKARQVGLAGSVLGSAGYVASNYSSEQAELAKQAESIKLANQEFDNKQTKLADNMNTIDNRSYFQVAKDSMTSGYNTVATKASSFGTSVKTTASDIYTNATYENMKNATVDGFNTATTFAKENPYKTAGGVAAVAALTYGAYKLYNSDMFAKSKAPVTPVTPVKKQVRRPRVNFSSNYGV